MRTPTNANRTPPATPRSTLRTPQEVGKDIEAVAGLPTLCTPLVRDRAARRLTPLLGEVNAKLSKGAHHWEPFPGLYKPEARDGFIRAATHLMPDEAMQRAGLTAVRPPDDVHRMQKSDPYWVGDFHSANFTFHALDACGLVRPNLDVLDIGCSSGSLVRLLAAHEPSWRVKGCDPVSRSIEWAQANLSKGEFFTMDVKPPLDLPTASLDGAVAISVWSHHRADAAAVWAEEMARVLRPGGWFVVTWSSIHHVRWMSKLPQATGPMLEKMLQAMADTGNHFKAIDFPKEAIESDVDWGQSCFSRERFFQIFAPWFATAGYFPGLNQGNQDVSVFVRR